MDTVYKNAKYFALDLSPTNNSKLLVGDAVLNNPDYKFSSLIWSEKWYQISSYYKSRVSKISHQFTVYKFEFCGANLLLNYSSNWRVNINTGIEGIVLPAGKEYSY